MSYRHTILIIEDEERTLKIMALYLEQAGYRVVGAKNGADGLAQFEAHQPDLVLLDIMLPVLDGWEVCKIIRQHSPVPIIMITARTSDEDAIKGLQLGADDYVRKPIKMPEVLARIGANLRRALGQLVPAQGLKVGAFFFDPAQKFCTLKGNPLLLTTKQFQILLFFAQHPHQVLTRTQIIEGAFGYDYDGYDRAVDIQINRLRKMIELTPAEPRYLVSVYGAGYQFIPE